MRVGICIRRGTKPGGVLAEMRTSNVFDSKSRDFVPQTDWSQVHLLSKQERLCALGLALAIILSLFK